MEEGSYTARLVFGLASVGLSYPFIYILNTVWTVPQESKGTVRNVIGYSIFIIFAIGFGLAINILASTFGSSLTLEWTITIFIAFVEEFIIIQTVKAFIIFFFKLCLEGANSGSFSEELLKLMLTCLILGKVSR